MKWYHLTPFTSFMPPGNHIGLPKACKKSLHATTCVWSLLHVKKQLCVYVPYTKVLGRVLAVSDPLPPILVSSTLCAICYFTPCQSLGSFVVTLGCNAVLQICVQMLWLSINGTFLPLKRTLSCSLVRMISDKCIGCFWVPRMFCQEYREVT